MLTHWSQDKMVAIFRYDIFEFIYCVFDSTFTDIILKGLIKNNPALVQIMA